MATTPRRFVHVPAPAHLVAALCCALAGEGRAAGGHFAVDDATVLDPGQCQVETWVERHAAAGTLTHVGPGCRAGPVELALNADHLRGESSATLVGPQVKWVGAIDERVSVGVVALAGWTGHADRYANAALYAIGTVRLADGIWLHVNGGRDWYAVLPPTSRAGVSLEWQATPAWSLIGEGYRQSGANVGRVGVRWQASSAVSIDLSRAWASSTMIAPWWTAGVNWSFGPWSR
jgi:hypothetical protein